MKSIGAERGGDLVCLTKYPVVTTCVLVALVVLQGYLEVDLKRITKFSLSGVELSDDQSQKFVQRIPTFDSRLKDLEGRLGSSTLAADGRGRTVSPTTVRGHEAETEP